MGDVQAEAAADEPDDTAAKAGDGPDAADDVWRYARNAADAWWGRAGWGAARAWRHEWDRWDAARWDG